jgi:aminomethyltransferase
MSGPHLKRTALFDYHQKHAKLTDFAGYEMPLWYSNTPEEHLAVRNRAGIFDVSHMGRAVLEGPDADAFMDSLLPTTASSQPPGKSFYTLLLTERGGIIDDLIVVKWGSNSYLLVVNAANTEKDLKVIEDRSRGYDVTKSDVTSNSTMIAVQGPSALGVLTSVVHEDLSVVKRFRSINTNIGGLRATVSRTGYTGEDGFEIILHGSGADNPAPALHFWEELARNATPCGLGARDSLRIEAAYPLYGLDIGEETNPYEAGLDWVISRDGHRFIGSDSLAQMSTSGQTRARKGVILDQGIPRTGFSVLNMKGEALGAVTSGTFSPILRKGIALCYLRKETSEPGTPVEVRVRDSAVKAQVVRTPFYDETKYGWKRTG